MWKGCRTHLVGLDHLVSCTSDQIHYVVRVVLQMHHFAVSREVLESWQRHVALVQILWIVRRYHRKQLTKCIIIRYFYRILNSNCSLDSETQKQPTLSAVVMKLGMRPSSEE